MEADPTRVCELGGCPLGGGPRDDPHGAARRVRQATVRYYFDADVLGLGKTVAGLRPRLPPQASSAGPRSPLGRASNVAKRWDAVDDRCLPSGGVGNFWSRLGHDQVASPPRTV